MHGGRRSLSEGSANNSVTAHRGPRHPVGQKAHPQRQFPTVLCRRDNGSHIPRLKIECPDASTLRGNRLQRPERVLLENQLQAQLDRAGASGSAEWVRCRLVRRYAPAAENPWCRIVAANRARIRDNSVIQNVEEFGAELGRKPFFCLPILEQGKIPIAEARAAEHIPTRRSEGTKIKGAIQSASQLAQHNLNLMCGAIVRKWNICAIDEYLAVHAD